MSDVPVQLIVAAFQDEKSANMALKELKQAIYIIEDGEHKAFLNPTIISKSSEEMMVWDSCFCYDVDIFVLIERSRDIELEYNTPDGKLKKEKFSGPLSELLQHEVDHLNGKFFFDHLNPIKRQLLKSRIRRT